MTIECFTWKFGHAFPMLPQNSFFLSLNGAAGLVTAGLEKKTPPAFFFHSVKLWNNELCNNWCMAILVIFGKNACWTSKMEYMMKVGLKWLLNWESFSPWQQYSFLVSKEPQSKKAQMIQNGKINMKICKRIKGMVAFRGFFHPEKQPPPPRTFPEIGLGPKVTLPHNQNPNS